MKRPSIIQAFTLIELVIVIGIIGIMIAIPTYAFRQITSKSRDARRKDDIEKVNTALQQYRAEYGYFPKETTYTALANDLSPTFISVLPQDPLNNGAYVYSYSGDMVNGEFYTLGATMEKTNGGNNEHYYSTTSGGMTITGVPPTPTTYASPTGLLPLSIPPSPSETPTPTFTPTPTP